jgi:phage-related protein
MSTLALSSQNKDNRHAPVSGWALEAAQFGGRHPAAKPWKGVGPRVLEIVEDFDGNAYRAVYTVRFEHEARYGQEQK